VTSFRCGPTIDAVRHVRDTARRVASLPLLGPALDVNYDAVTTATASWPPVAAMPETNPRQSR
jgi:hypothetical protein